ncbi:hypothetical protein NQ314_011790 [Rhamnusium bicolor]|uniref:TFIIH p62 subunit N-terminal domain-containing protein n=1 Tax=Rhamnusium bicolor TaxID=1586634 RepID=A0AAV8XG88_9CUCU|nr:hypothetical protein NQ314_011790 [Rhamnusium bicolor]
MEDVLYKFHKLDIKKGDGSLFLMDQRLIWMIENRNTVAVSHPYADIKLSIHNCKIRRQKSHVFSSKISPEGKAKVQLQVVLHNGVSSTFHFINKNGLQAQLIDRDKVKEMLQSLLPKFKRKVQRFINLHLFVTYSFITFLDRQGIGGKNKLLSSNPALLQLYKDLKQKQQPQDIGPFIYYMNQLLTILIVGVSGAFLAGIKPQTDGCNGLKYNITPDIIECMVQDISCRQKKVYRQCPIKTDRIPILDQVFPITLFSQVHSIDRKYAESKDIFTECGKIDDQEMKKDIQSGVDDPLVDITEFEDKTLGEGYGNTTEKPPSNTGTVSQAMIKRFNQHSIMVLKATKNKVNDTTTQNGADPKTSKTNGVTDNNEKQEVEPVSKKQKILEKITYDDLEDIDENKNRTTSNLSLSKVERYLHGPVPDSTTEYLNPKRGLVSFTRNPSRNKTVDT